jgi:upstream-binding transcription factor
MSITLENVVDRVATLEYRQQCLFIKMDALCEQLLEVISKKEKKAKKAKKDAASSDDEEKPKKKRVSGYILFSNANRDEVKEKLAESDEKPKNTEVMKELAKKWRELGDEEKEVWNTKAKELKDNA